MTAYSDNGEIIATKEFDLLSYEKVVNLAEDFFTQDIISATTYISYSSDENVVCFQVNGSSDNMMLDGFSAGSIR